MILSRFGPATAYRMHAPRWAGSPLSGAGAGAHGGRANRPGTPALYLALDAQTAIREYQQVSALLPPGTLVSYTVALTQVVDFSDGYEAASWDPLWQDFDCDWRSLWFDLREEPPSWVLGDLVLDAGGKGIVFRSRLTGGLNLVCYTEALRPLDTSQPAAGHDILVAYDPEGALPKNQESWR